MRLKTIVLKFGGTSVGSIERIKIVSKIILSHKSKNTKVAVISSVMSGVTNALIKKTKSISNNLDSDIVSELESLYENEIKDLKLPW